MFASYSVISSPRHFHKKQPMSGCIDCATVQPWILVLLFCHFREYFSVTLQSPCMHADSDGNLAVIALMFEEGTSHPVIEALWESLPAHEGETHALEITVDPLDLLPQDTDYYRFNGSLTTPPCSEGVWWLVMKQPVPVSAEQVEAFAHTLHEANNRPVLPVNARPILR